MLDFFERIDVLLKEKKISQKDLCCAVGISSVQVFTNWKLRDSIPSADVAVKIARLLDVSVEYLVTGEENNPLSKKVDRLEQQIEAIRKIVET